MNQWNNPGPNPVDEQEKKDNMMTLIIAGGIVMVMLILTVIFVVYTFASGPDDPEPAPVEIAQPEDDEMEFGISNDELKKEVMDRAKKAGWEYTWEDERKNDFYTAWDLVLSRKTKRIGLTVYVGKAGELDAIADETEAPNITRRFKGALFVFAPMPGQEMSKKVLEAFEE